MKKFKYFTKAKSEKGITLIALIVTIIVLVIIAGISIATLTADNGVLRQTNSAKVESIEGTAREQVKLAVGAMRLAIAEAQSLDNSYKASANTSAIQAKLLEVIRADTTALEKDGWSSADDTANSFKIIYAGDDYKQACNDDNAEIVYTITLGQKSIEITNETNATLKDQSGNDVNLDIGGSTGAGTGNGSGSGSGEGSGGGTQEPVALEAGLYDANDNLVASWDELVNTYGMDVTKSYTSSTYNTDTASPYYVLTNNPKLDNGVKLLMDESITRIGSFAFYNCTNITSITIPNSVTSINERSFSCCKNLVSVEITNSVKYIDGYAFQGCTSLENVTIPNSVTNIGWYAFNSCTKLTSVTLGNGIVQVASSVFTNCSNLKTVYYEGTIEQWCNISFTNTDSGPCHNGAILYIDGELAEDIEIPNTITKISKGFAGCTSIKSIKIPENTTNIETGAFYNCANLKTVYYEGTIEKWCNITFGGSAYESYSSAANPCYNGATLYISGELANDISIPNTVEKIGRNTFYNCMSLTNITISDGTTNIEQYAFYGCKNLASITIPDSITNIEKNVFSNSNNIKTVYYEGTIEQWCNISFDSEGSNPCYNGTALYIDGELLTGDITIPNTVTEIKQFAFCNYTSLTSVMIPNSVTTIDACAFLRCTNLTSIIFDENSQLTTIGSAAFRYCTRLESIIIPENVTSIGDFAFSSTSVEYGSIVILATEPPTLGGRNVFPTMPVGSRPITVPAGCADAYKAASGWSEYASYIVEAQ